MQTEIGNWRLGEILGEGGMGTVYLAHHKTLGTQAACKILASSFSRDPKFRERFIREAKAHAQLRHPGIAQVIDFTEQGDELYLIMEYLPGGTLADVLEREKRPLPLATSLSWARGLLSALDYAHQAGVIHRDVKPSNILFDKHGRPKLVDFGIALVLDGRRLTTSGTLGTPHYMSPEQIRRPLEVDHRTDVYSMGVVLYEMLAGRTPFDGESDFDVRYAQVIDSPKPLRVLNPEVSEKLEAIVLRAMAKKPAERFAGCGQMERELAALDREVPEKETSGSTPLLQPAPSPTQPRRWLTPVIAGLALVLAFLAGALITRGGHQGTGRYKGEEKPVRTLPPKAPVPLSPASQDLKLPVKTKAAETSTAKPNRAAPDQPRITVLLTAGSKAPPIPGDVMKKYPTNEWKHPLVKTGEAAWTPGSVYYRPSAVSQVGDLATEIGYYPRPWPADLAKTFIVTDILVVLKPAEDTKSPKK